MTEERARQLLEQAQRCRRLAAAINNPETSAAFLELAERYEAQAERREDAAETSEGREADRHG